MTYPQDDSNTTPTADAAAPNVINKKANRLKSDLDEQSQYKSLIEQIRTEYIAARNNIEPKLYVWRRRLKLLNNQRKDEAAVGDVTLFTQFQSILAALYNDQLMTTFKGTNEGDVDVGDTLTDLAKHDTVIMRKPEFDYFWDWNTIFFGRSVVYFTTFSRKKGSTPIPELANMLTFLPDPDAVAINGDTNGYNACRFFGREITMTKYQMEANPEFFDIDQLEPGQQMIDNVQTEATQALQDAQGTNITTPSEEKKYGDNAKYYLTEWCTHWRDKDGKVKKILCTVGNSRSKVVRMKIFMEDGKLAEQWPVGDRPLYPSSNDWFGTSLPDLVEDKQRMRAVLNNLAIKGIKADLYPSYLYIRKRFKNRGDFNLDINKFIPVEGEDARTAITPMQRASMNLPLYNSIMQSLELSAQQATSTPEMEQGRLSEERRTATELSLVNQGVDTRYSLTARVFGWSEKWFWMRWYRLYKDNFKDKIDEKILRLEGAFGPTFRTLTRDNIIADADPDVEIESRVVADSVANQKKQDFFGLMNLLVNYPGTNLRYGMQKLAKMAGLEHDEVSRLLPASIDEMIAEDENKMLSDDKMVFVQANDDHQMHLQIHAKASDTPATFSHIAAHRHALELKKSNPQLFPQPQQQQGVQPQISPGQQPPVQPGNPMQPLMDANAPKAPYMQQ